MSIEIKVPTLGESVTEATIGQWFKQVGDAVKADEPLVELETDKVTIELPAPAAGTVEAISVKQGETVAVGALIGAIAEGAAPAKGKAAAAAASAAKQSAAEPAKSEPALKAEAKPDSKNDKKSSAMPPAPSALKMLAEAGIDAAAVKGTGKRGQVLKEDVLAFLDKTAPSPAATPSVPVAKPRREPAPAEDEAREERVKLSRLRLTIARRLKDAQNTAAMLTTFNEVDMSPVMTLRAQYKELFEKKHGVKLGFMGFFTLAVVQALKDIPAVNAEIDGDEVVYKNYAHIGVAVGTDKGLVVPVIRDADRLGLAGIEREIARLGAAARDGKLTMDDMQGGTFTISNGGVYGSLMSTPILNAPQSGILGMHKIEERPVVVDKQIVIRPMMYLALSYDHRIVDGREAVTFLVRVKESLEAPERLVLDL